MSHQEETKKASKRQERPGGTERAQEEEQAKEQLVLGIIKSQLKVPANLEGGDFLMKLDHCGNLIQVRVNPMELRMKDFCLNG